MGKNWFEKTIGGFIEETGEFLSENAGGILTLGGAAMGIPPETLAIAKTVLGAMGKKGSSTADKTNALIQSGIDAQTAYQLAALDETKAAGQCRIGIGEDGDRRDFQSAGNVREARINP